MATAIIDATDESSSEAATRHDAYALVLHLTSGEMPDVLRIIADYNADEIRDLFGAVSGVFMGVFTHLSPELQRQVRVHAPVLRHRG